MLQAGRSSELGHGALLEDGREPSVLCSPRATPPPAGSAAPI